MKIITGDLLSITSGVIVQQVNCQNAYGRGLSGIIAQKYPAVLSDYRASFQGHTHEEMFGQLRLIPIRGTDIIVANSYSQFYYGNARKTHICYTDMNKLVSNLELLASQFEKIYIPYLIGCDLAGGDWNELVKRISHLPITVIQKIKEA